MNNECSEAQAALWDGTFLEVEGYRIFYRQAGEGPPIVFLHGWTGNSYQWKKIALGLSRQFRVIAPDLLGSGRSDKPRLRYTIPQFLSNINGFVEQMNIPHMVLVGTSFGGFLAMRYCLEFPASVRALILLNASGIRARYSWIFNACTIPVLGYLIPYLLLIPREVKLWLGSKIGRNAEFHRGLLREYRHSTLTLRSWAGLRSSLQSIRSIDAHDMLDDRLGNIRCPVLIFWGDRDNALPVEMAYRYHKRIQGSRLEFLSGCGHNIPEERPEEVVRGIQEFLGSSSFKAE